LAGETLTGIQKLGNFKMKIALIGKHGLLGSDCLQVFSRIYELVALDIEELDITDYSQVEEMVQGLHPEVVLNCAAYTRVDACEQERDLAYRLNVTGVRNLAASLARHGGRLVHISTDYVFDGSKPVPESYSEDDAVGPLSYYGRTKLQGEQAVMQELDDYVIVRTAWLYGRRGQNFLKTMLRLALNHPASQIRVVDDQFGSLTWSYRLAEQLTQIIEKGGQGVYHATSEGYATWFEVASVFLAGMGIVAHLTPCTTADYPTPARRPKNSILENRRLKAQGLNLMRPWQDDLHEFILANRAYLIQEARQALSAQ
jgi:dTDP-4-dehydrorhamnose reductase